MGHVFHKLVRRAKPKRAFTLLELLAVVATIVIFASILMTSNQNAINQANSAVQLQQEEQLREALQMWVMHKGANDAATEWATIKDSPNEVLQRAQMMLAPATRGVFVFREGKIMSDASVNMGTAFYVTWDPNDYNQKMSGPVVSVSPIPVASVPNPSPTPSPGASPSPGSSPSPTPGTSPGASPSPSPGTSPGVTPSPSPIPITISPAALEGSLSLLLFPTGIVPNQNADLKIVAENPASVPLQFTLSGTIPAGVAVTDWTTEARPTPSLTNGNRTFSWSGTIPARGAQTFDCKLTSAATGIYTINFGLTAGLAVNPNLGLAADLADSDTATLSVTATPTPTPGLWDFNVLPNPSPVPAGNSVVLKLEPVYRYNPAVEDVYMLVSVPSAAEFIGLSNPGGALFSGQELSGSNRIIRFYLGRGDRDLSGVKPELAFASQSTGSYAATGGLGRTVAASEYSEGVGTMSWGVAPSPSPSPALNPLRLRQWAKGAPATITQAGVAGGLILQFANDNPVAVNYRVKVKAMGTPPRAAMNKTSSDTYTFTGTLQPYSVVDVSSELGFISNAANPSFSVRVEVAGQPDLNPPNLSWP